MNQKLLCQLDNAVQYAIESDYDNYNKAVDLIRLLHTKKNICIFGMGRFFVEGYPYIKNRINAKYVCDSNAEKIMQSGIELYGLEAIGLEALSKLEDVICIIMVGAKYKEVKKQLDDMRIQNVYIGDLILNCYTEKHDAIWFEKERENILETLLLFDDEWSRECFVEIICNRIAPHLATKLFLDIQTEGEYFETGLWEYEREEMFVDVGAYTGDTIETFLDCANRNNVENTKVYAFEMNKSIYEQLKSNISKLNMQEVDVELYNVGIAASVDEKNGFTSLDAILKGKDVSLVKMDIEGYELEALRGAERILIEQKPKMAVCLYHRLEDLWEIPQYIKKLNPNYKMYIRHHSPVAWDSVLYVR